jgi:hypothetical protein
MGPNLINKSLGFKIKCNLPLPRVSTRFVGRR